METMEPPESTSGVPLVGPPDAANGAEAAGDRPNDPDFLGEPEVLEEAEEGLRAPSGGGEGAPPGGGVPRPRGGGGWREPALESLAAQDYPALSVLVLDNAAPADPTARI